MVVSKALPVVLCTFFMTGCSFNRTMFESARPGDSDHILKEYGDKEPGTSIVVLFQDQQYDFVIYSSKLHNRILVQSTPSSAAGTKGLAETGTLSFIKQRLDEAPYRQAAMTYLANQKLSGCKLEFGSELLHKAFEWTYTCSKK